MVAAIALFIVAFVVVAVAGTMLQGGNDSGAGGPQAGDDDTGLPDATPSNAPAAGSIDNITLSGSNDAITERFELSSGVVIFHMTYDGPNNFIVTLYDSAGEMGTWWPTRSAHIPAAPWWA